MATGDWADDREVRRWMKAVLKDLVPKIDGSAAVVSVVPKSDTDVKFAVELGFSIMMDKPIILVVTPGVKIPEKMRRLADEIVEGDISDPNVAIQFPAAINRAVDRSVTEHKDREDLIDELIAWTDVQRYKISGEHDTWTQYLEGIDDAQGEVEEILNRHGYHRDE
jgi:hypothetical protein